MYRSFLARPFDVILLRFTSLNTPLNVMFDTKQENYKFVWVLEPTQEVWLQHKSILKSPTLSQLNML